MVEHDRGGVPTSNNLEYPGRAGKNTHTTLGEIYRLKREENYKY